MYELHSEKHEISGVMSDLARVEDESTSNETNQLASASTKKAGCIDEVRHEHQSKEFVGSMKVTGIRPGPPR